MATLRCCRFRRLPLSFSILLAGLLVLNSTLPYDSSLRLFFRWQSHTVISRLHPPNHHHFSNTSTWYPVEMENVGIIIKTGYGTRAKLAARVASYDESRNRESIVIVADYASPDARGDGNKGVKLPVHDVLESTLQHAVEFGSAANTARVEQYTKLRNAIAKGLKDLPRGVNGWELDIMKHIPGLELGYKLMPGRHWYVLCDDDTFILPESLLAVLEGFDPFVPHYLGNAIGSYDARFAHGGSAIVLSQMAMQKLFVEHPEVADWAKHNGVVADLGDKVISQALMKVGVYIEERWGLHFNGEPPRKTRIQADRFCEVVATFHQLTSDEMDETAKVFGALRDPIAWIDIWVLLTPEILSDGPDLGFPAMRTEWDYVGMTDGSVAVYKDIATAGDCQDLCLKSGKKCLAWVWKGGLCHGARWLIVGEKMDGATSGINVRAANKLARCD